MTVVPSILLIGVLLVILYVLGTRKKSQLNAANWEQLIARLKPVSIGGISKVALEYLQPHTGPLTVQTDDMWSLIGGYEGIRRMQANADVLIALAAFTQQGNFQECVIVAERMRHDGLALRRAARNLYFGRWLGSLGRTKRSFNVQEIASSYYLMRQRLLALYQTSHAGRYPRLGVALGYGLAACGSAI